MAAEKELLEGISLMKQGKEEGFHILYSYTYNFVYARARSATKNEADAQDLTQETFIQAYKGIASLEDANNVYAWLGGIVFRQGAKLYNKTKKELLLNEDQDYIFDELETKDTDALPEARAELKATSDVVMSMIEELPELQRSAIVSFYYDHMKIEEIAKIFDCSANTIKSRLNYAKKFLKSKVEEHQKQYSYKLFSFSPAVLLLALRELLSSEKYTMAPEAAEKVYHVACETLGITASAVALGTTTAASSAATAGTAATTGATASAGAASTAALTETAATATTTTAKGAGLLGKFLAQSAAKKAGSILLAATLLGGGAATTVLLTNQPSKAPIIAEQSGQELSELTSIPEVTSAPVLTDAPSVTAKPLPVGNYVYSLEEFYAYLGQQAKTGVEHTQVFLHTRALEDPFNKIAALKNVPELQRYAGINVSLQTTLSKTKEEVEYTCLNGDLHTTQFRIADVSFTYGDTEIAAYNEEDYWEKVKNALMNRMETFTIYTIASADQPEVQWNKFGMEEYPTEDLAEVFSDVVCYLVDSTHHVGPASQTFVSSTYHCVYPDRNDIIVESEFNLHSTISEWYEGNREPGVVFFIHSSHYNELGYSVSEKITNLQDWFTSEYPSSEYVMEFETFPESRNYYTCTIKKPGDPTPAPEVLPPVDDTVSLSPIATPWPTPSPIPNIVLSDEEVTTTATRIISEIVTPNMSETEKVKAIHDYMILHMDPDAHTEFLHNIPKERTTVNGALGSGYASCAGYAATFLYLCDLAGLEALCITGETSSCKEHTWNQVNVDGNWYHIDVFADENMATLTKEFADHSGAIYSYFLVSDDDLGYTISQTDPVPHPCTAKSIAYGALEYGCPWAFLVFNPSEEEITLAAEKASAEGRTNMKLIFPDRRYLSKNHLLESTIYMGSYKNHYATEGLIISNTSQPGGGDRVFYSYDIWFLAKDGIPVTYPYADTTEKVHEAVTQAVKEHKTRLYVYAPDLVFLRAAVSSYPRPEKYTSGPAADRTLYGEGITRPDTLFYISIPPEEDMDWPY